MTAIIEIPNSFLNSCCLTKHLDQSSYKLLNEEI